MLEGVITSPQVRQEIGAAGFKPSLEELMAKLYSQGYAEMTVWFYGQAAVHFAFWAARKQVDASEVNERYVASLAICVDAVAHLAESGNITLFVQESDTLRWSFEVGILCPGIATESPDRFLLELERFDEYMRTASGLQEATRIYRSRYVRQFLEEFFGDGTVDASRLSPEDVVQYLSRRASLLKPASAKVLASSLRSYFRFLRLHGECDDTLILAVPAPATYRLASLPKVLADEEVSRLLTVFNRRTGTGRRDYAMARCLADLGLRAGEVARLRLQDIDWRKGTLRIVGTKARRDDELPLPPLLGAAIAAYIRRGRPVSSERQVFLRARAPVGQALTRRTVCNVILRAAARAGMKSVTGTRILRHTAATRMLNHGASIKEIADILRHRSLDTTAIYTKIDLPRLAAVASPWPDANKL